MSATTIWLDRETHARLLSLKQKRQLSSLGAAIRSLLDDPVESAQTIYARNKAAVDDVCQRHGVKRLVAYGSRARGDARPDSDLDLAVQVPSDLGLDIIALFRELEQALAHPTDITDWPTSRPRLLAEIERDGVTLYEQG